MFNSNLLFAKKFDEILNASLLSVEARPTRAPGAVFAIALCIHTFELLDTRHVGIYSRHERRNWNGKILGAIMETRTTSMIGYMSCLKS